MASETEHDANPSPSAAYEDHESKPSYDTSETAAAPATTDTHEEKAFGTDYAKLFVGQVPVHMQEEDLRKLFEPYGPVAEVVVLKDRLTKQHQGCGFVAYFKKEDADKAIEALNDKVSLSHAKRNIIVRYAGSQGQQYKLFIGMLAKTSDEERIRQIFEAYGSVAEVYLMKDSNTGQSKGSAFVKYNDRQAAENAITALNGQFTDEGAPRPLTVKFADTQQEKQTKKTPQASLAQPAASPYGYPQMQGYGQYPGYGMQQMNPYGQYAGYGMQQQQPGYGYGMAANMQPQQQQQPQQSSNYGRAKESRGPAGANLFVFNIPEHFTDGDLASLFASFGTIVSTKVFCDKVTGQSKGFGFVSYTEPASADAAIGGMNGYEVGNKRLKVQHKKDGDGPGIHGGRGYAPY